MDNLFPQPHQADEGAQRASDYKTALEGVRKQVLPARENSHTTKRMQCERELRGKIETGGEFKLTLKACLMAE